MRCVHAGGILAGVTREATKQLALVSLGPVYRAAPTFLRRLWRPPIHNMGESPLTAHGIPVNKQGVPWDVLTTSRFVSYACLAWIVLGGSFEVFKALGW